MAKQTMGPGEKRYLYAARQLRLARQREQQTSSARVDLTKLRQALAELDRAVKGIERTIRKMRKAATW